jgi:hypothetical protein
VTEIITAIEEYSNTKENTYYGAEAGYRITTDQQEIIFAIDDSASCCESWGYFASEDDFSKFIGTELYDISLTDTNLTTREFVKGWDFDKEYKDEDIHLDEGDVMFVNFETSNGRL